MIYFILVFFGRPLELVLLGFLDRRLFSVFCLLRACFLSGVLLKRQISAVSINFTGPKQNILATQRKKSGGRRSHLTTRLRNHLQRPCVLEPEWVRRSLFEHAFLVLGLCLASKGVALCVFVFKNVFEI